MPINSNAIVELPPDAATADDHRNPRRRRREAEEPAPEVGTLVHPDPRHELDSLILHQSVRQDILAGLRAVEMREHLERVWQISKIQPQQGRCILNIAMNAIHAGSTDVNEQKWKVTQVMLEREIEKARAAKAEHSGKAKREKQVIGFGQA